MGAEESDSFVPIPLSGFLAGVVNSIKLKKRRRGIVAVQARRVGKKIWGRKMVLLDHDDLVKWQDSV